MDQTAQTQINNNGNQPAGGGAESSALPPKLLLQRLKIETQLKRAGAGMSVSRNQIQLRASNHIATISVAPTTSGATSVDIEAVAGEVLLYDGLTEFIRARNEQIAPIRIEVAADRVVRVAWRGEYAGDVEAAGVVEALFAVAAVVESVQTALTEDFFLTTRVRPAHEQTTQQEAA
jgi:hypothetical protein